MLSILQRQAKHLEKELNDTRQNLLERSRALDGEKSRVTERDERIETLEIEIDALRNRPRASPKKRAASEPDGAPADADADDAPLSDEELEQLRALVKQLNASLEKKGRKLTHAELRANTYEIQMLAQKSAHMQQVDHLRERLRARSSASSESCATRARARARTAPTPSSRGCGSRCARRSPRRAARRADRVPHARPRRVAEVRLGDRGRATRPSPTARSNGRAAPRPRRARARPARTRTTRSRSRCSARRSARCGARARARCSPPSARTAAERRARRAAARPRAPARRPEAPPRPGAPCAGSYAARVGGAAACRTTADASDRRSSIARAGRTATAARIGASAAASAGAITNLMALGFDRSACEEALAASRGDEVAAIARLITASSD